MQHETAHIAEPPADNVWRSRYFGLVSLVTELSWLDDRSEFYDNLAGHLGAITGADHVNIRFLTTSQDAFVLYAHHGDLVSDVNRRYGVLSATAGRMPNLIKTGEPIVFDFAHPTSEDVDWDRGVADGFACSVTVALPGVHGIIGAADFLYHESQNFSDEDVEWLRSIGVFAGSIVSNALLTDNMISMRMADERHSLSSEIHDNIAQSISVISLEADNAVDSLRHGDRAMLERNLDLIRRASTEVEKLTRGELLNLRADLGADEESTLGRLEDSAASFCNQWGLAVSFTRDEADRAVRLSKRVMAQLNRVLNETLINVVKHAKADSVSISYAIDAGSLYISVADDGCGFDPDDVPASHLGLRIMEERLTSIGASMAIESSTDAGTTVRITVPTLV